MASVAGRLMKGFDEIPVDLPKTTSESPIILMFESDRNPIPRGGGGG